MSQPAPTASGTLSATPLGHLLIYALDRRLRGTLVFEETNRAKHAIYFADGAAASARTTVLCAPLGELAVEAGLIRADQLESAIESARDAGERLGQALMRMNCLDAPMLDLLLRDQVARRVKLMALLPGDTAYGYYAGVNYLERAGGPEAPGAPLELIWQVMRLSADPLRVRDLVQRLGATPLRLQTEAPIARFHFEGAERAVIDVLSAKPQPFPELSGRGLIDNVRLEQLVYTLALLKHFDTGTGSRPIGAEIRFSQPPQERVSVNPELPLISLSGPPPAPSQPAASRSVTPAPRSVTPAPPPAPAPAGSLPPLTAVSQARPAGVAEVPQSAEAEAFRRELRERSEATRQSYYDVLGVAQTAPVGEIAAAYFQLARRWHPDRLGPELADVRDLAERVFARMSEAHQVISDPERRAQYDELMKTGDGDAEEQEQVQRMLRAATNFQKAQVLLRRNNVAAAEEAARAALADAPEEADHIALVAWLEAQKPGAQLEEAFATVDRASRLEPSNLRVRWFRGQLLKRLGRERQAIEDFRLIILKDPRHVDAQREIRLFDMRRPQTRSESPPEGSRRPSPPPEAPSKSFLGKLFKR
jgi:curved DNA-binding protein CbpA